MSPANLLREKFAIAEVIACTSILWQIEVDVADLTLKLSSGRKSRAQQKLQLISDIMRFAEKRLH